jgi:hypothetical protein
MITKRRYIILNAAHRKNMTFAVKPCQKTRICDTTLKSSIIIQGKLGIRLAEEGKINSAKYILIIPHFRNEITG